MIVICTKCKAKFRVADEKVGPRGAKVRCSRCQTVFVVHPTPPVENPFVASPVRASPPPLAVAPARPPPLPGALPPPPPDPFAPALAEALRAAPAPAADPFAAPASDPFAPAPDPFAPAPDSFAPAADPFAPSPAAPSSHMAPDPSADPFFAGAGGDPFAAAPPASAPPGLGGASGPPVTDLADLLGAAAAAAPPSSHADAASDAPTPSDLGLSLEERVTPPPTPVAPVGPVPTAFAAETGAALETASPDDLYAPGASDGGAHDPGAFDLGGAADPAAAAAAPTAFAPSAAAPAAEPVPAAPASPRAAAPIASPPASSTRVGRPGGSLRAALVNVVALAALVVLALALLVVWRTDGPLDARLLRPAAIAAALSRGEASGPFAAQEIRSGLYERERGPPVLFVRGEIVSRAPAAVRALVVAVEVVRDGEVVARGTALAGAVPTPEELYGAPDAAALAAVAAAAAARAPAEVRPGETVPFLVAIADHPADLDRASLRVAIAPAGSAAP